MQVAKSFIGQFFEKKQISNFGALATKCDWRGRPFLLTKLNIF